MRGSSVATKMAAAMRMLHLAANPRESMTLGDALRIGPMYKLGQTHGCVSRVPSGVRAARRAARKARNRAMHKQRVRS